MNLAAISSGLSMGYSAIVLPQLKPYMDGGKEWYPHYRPFVIDEDQGSWIGKSTTRHKISRPLLSNLGFLISSSPFLSSL